MKSEIFLENLQVFNSSSFHRLEIHKVATKTKFCTYAKDSGFNEKGRENKFLLFLVLMFKYENMLTILKQH